MCMFVRQTRTHIAHIQGGPKDRTFRVHNIDATAQTSEIIFTKTFSEFLHAEFADAVFMQLLISVDS